MMEAFLLFILSLIPEQYPVILGLPAWSSLEAKMEKNLYKKSCKLLEVEGVGEELEGVKKWEEKGYKWNSEGKEFSGLTVFGDLLLHLGLKQV